MGIRGSVRSAIGTVWHSPDVIQRGISEFRDPVFTRHISDLPEELRIAAATGFHALELGHPKSGLSPEQRRACLEAALADCIDIPRPEDMAAGPKPPVFEALIAAIGTLLEEAEP